MVISYSIIIPHYNIPDLLMRCLKSIPVREDVQVIVVDDCSPDADTYLERYPELSRPYLEFYSTDNGGSAGRARNVGLRHAKGKWVTFMDSDDLFSDQFDPVLDVIVEKDEDIVFTNIKFVDSDDVTSEITRSGSGVIGSYFDAYMAGECGENVFRYSFPSLWGKFIKRVLIEQNNIWFDEVRWANDIFFSTQVGCLAKKVNVLNVPIYLATKRKGSLTYNYLSSEKEFITRLRESLKSESFMVSHNVKEYMDHSVNVMQGMYKNIGQLGFLKIILHNSCDVQVSLPMLKYYLGSRLDAIKRILSI